MMRLVLSRPLVRLGFAVALAALWLWGCQGRATPALPTVQPASQPAPAPTSTVPDQPSPTPTLATPQPAAVVRISSQAPDVTGGQYLLEVLEGEALLRSSVRLSAGSQQIVHPDELTFVPGMQIEIGPGGATLNGVTYREGTRLRVDSSGALVEVNQPVPSATPGQAPFIPSATPGQAPFIPSATPGQPPAIPSATPLSLRQAAHLAAV